MMIQAVKIMWIYLVILVMRTCFSMIPDDTVGKVRLARGLAYFCIAFADDIDAKLVKRAVGRKIEKHKASH